MLVLFTSDLRAAGKNLLCALPLLFHLDSIAIKNIKYLEDRFVYVPG